MGDNLDGSNSRSSHPIPAAGAECGAHAASAAANMFSAALQQLSTSTPTASRGDNAFSWPRNAAAAGGGGRWHVECDSDGFVDSDDDNAEEDGEAALAKSASSSSSSSSDSSWGTFHGGEPQLAMCKLGNDVAGDSDEEDAEDDVLFVPDPIFDLNSLQHKPIMPCLPREQLPVGATVWVVDEDDVATQLNCYFSSAYPPVCNGRLSGTVVRHTGLLTLVRFDNEASDLCFALCVPTSCLSLQPVEPYESSPRHGEPYGLCSGAYGMLGPRTAGRGSGPPAGDTIVVTRYLYESMPAYDAEKLRGTALEKAQVLFFHGSYEKALTAVNEYLAESTFSNGEGGNPSKEQSASLVDALVLRSRIFIFLDRYAEALEDACTSVKLEPQWVRSHLSVARAHCGLGQFTEAAAAIAHAYIMLPYSSELKRIKELNGYMHSLQLQLRRERAGCYIILDGFYRKRLRVSVATAAGVSLCRETTPIVATHSVFAARAPLHRCAMCFRSLSPSMITANADSTACSGYSASSASYEHARVSSTTAVSPALSSPVGPDPDEGVQYCSTECVQRASLYRPLELRHRASLDHVRSLFLSKGAVTLNVLPLEMAAMAVRLFLMVVTTHRRLSAKRRLEESNRRGAESVGSHGASEKDAEPRLATTTGMHNSGNPLPFSSPPPVYVETALQRLGVFPLCTESLKSNKLDELKVVYDVLTADFKAEDRTTFSFELLTQLYSYVNAYFTPVDLNALLQPDVTGHPVAHHTVYYLPNYVGCIEVAKTISYTATSRWRDSSDAGATEVADEPLKSKVTCRPALDEPLETNTENSVKQREDPTRIPSNNEANCTVLPVSKAALLELVTVAPINPEHKLRCVPVSMAPSSDVA